MKNEKLPMVGSSSGGGNTSAAWAEPGMSQATSSGSGEASKKIQLTHVEDVQPTPAGMTRQQKFKKHFARFWICYLIAAVILAAILLPILFLVIIPAIAQSIVNKTELPIYKATLLAQTSHSVKIGLATALDVPGGLTVGLDPLELWLYNADTGGDEFSPYTMVPLPYESVSGHTEIEVKDQVVEVGNRTELRTWLTRTLHQVDTDISVRGNTTAHLGKLHFPISLDKTVSIKGLRNLEGFALLGSRVVLPPEDDGSNLVGNLTLPNWSPLTIGLGNLTLNVWAGDLLVGKASVFDVLLPPGNSTLPFRGEVFLPTVFQNLPTILASQSATIGTGRLHLGVNGNSTVIDGEHITYLEEVLQDTHLTTDIPILQLLTDVSQSVLNGDTTLQGVGDLLGDNLGGLVDSLFGDGSSGDSSGGGGGILSGLGGLLSGSGGGSNSTDGNSTGSGLLSGLADSLNLTQSEAKLKFRRGLTSLGGDNVLT